MILARPASWKSIILLCGKCARKMKGGYGAKGRDTLRTMLRETLREHGRRRDCKIIETRCMGICPRKAVTAVNAERPDTLFTIPKGTSPNEALSRLIDSSER
jgi:predicted metal-binding protein